MPNHKEDTSNNRVISAPPRGPRGLGTITEQCLHTRNLPGLAGATQAYTKRSAVGDAVIIFPLVLVSGHRGVTCSIAKAGSTPLKMTVDGLVKELGSAIVDPVFGTAGKSYLLRNLPLR